MWGRGQGHQDSRLSVPKSEPLLKKLRLGFAKATSRGDSYWVPAAMREPVAAGVGLLGKSRDRYRVSELGDRSGYDRCPGPARQRPHLYSAPRTAEPESEVPRSNLFHLS